MPEAEYLRWLGLLSYIMACASIRATDDPEQLDQ
jgi:hypothetical protein